MLCQIHRQKQSRKIPPVVIKDEQVLVLRKIPLRIIKQVPLNSYSGKMVRDLFAA